MTAHEMRGEHLRSSGERFAVEPGMLSRLVAPGFRKVLDRVDAGLKTGSLFAHLPDGTTRMLGGRAPGFDVEVWLKDWRALLRLATGGAIGWYQAYEAGEWEASDHVILFALFSDNVRTLDQTARSSGLLKWTARLAHRLNRNSKIGSVRNISAHYDLGNDFYSAWLDRSMTYSSGLGLSANGSDDGLEAAQLRKLESISSRVGQPQRVLEIGCGWGSLAQHLSGKGAKVTAISLSDEQLSWARANTSGDIDYRKQDYRDVGGIDHGARHGARHGASHGARHGARHGASHGARQGTSQDASQGTSQGASQGTGQGTDGGVFDAIVSVEMVEAIGREYWGEFLDCIARNLKPGGRAALQYISMDDDLFETYSSTVDFIQAYVFPGGMLIKSSELRALAEARGLVWHEQTSFGGDYAKTLAVWRKSFDRAVEEARLPNGFDDSFIRFWRFYLSYCEGGFQAGTIDVHQVTLIKN